MRKNSLWMFGEIKPDGVIESQQPRPALFGPIDKVAAFALAIVVTYLITTESLVWVPFVLGALVGIFSLLVRWPRGAILELLVAGSIPRWFMPVSSWNAKPEHMVAAACGGVLLFRICAKRHVWQR